MYGGLGVAPPGSPARTGQGYISLNPTFGAGDAPVTYTPILYGDPEFPEGVPLTGGIPVSVTGAGTVTGKIPTTVAEARAMGYLPPPPSAARWTAGAGTVAALAAGFFLLTR